MSYQIGSYQVYIKSDIIKIVSEDYRTFQMELDSPHEIFSNKDIIIEMGNNKLIINNNGKKIYVPEIKDDFDFRDIQIIELKKIINDMNKKIETSIEENDNKIKSLETNIEEIKKENDLLKSYLGNNIFLHGSRMGINKFTLRLTLYVSNYSYKKEEHISICYNDWGQTYPIDDPGITEKDNKFYKKMLEYNIFYDNLVPRNEVNYAGGNPVTKYSNINIRHTNMKISETFTGGLGSTPAIIYNTNMNINMCMYNNKKIQTLRPDLMYDEQYYHNVCDRDISNIKYLKFLKYLHLIKRGYISCNTGEYKNGVLNCYGNQIKNDWYIINFDIIEDLENLEALVLEDINDNIDINILIKLTKLKFLKIIDCDNIINSDKFNEFKNLELLWLENTNIKSLPKQTYMVKIDNNYSI